MNKYGFVITLLIILCLILLPAAAFAQVSGASKTVTLPGGGTRSVTALQIDLNDPHIRIFSVHAQNRIGATASLQDIANQVAGDKYEVVCAINGTFFDAYVQGAQIGLGAVVSNGEMFYKIDGSLIGFGEDNQVEMDWIHIECIGAVDNRMDKDHSFYIHNWNRILPKTSNYREAILTPAFGANTGDIDMNVLTVRNGYIQSITKGNTTIPRDGYVYIYPDNSPYNDGRFQVDKPIRYETTYYDKNGTVVDWSYITNITGVGPSLIKNGVKTANPTAEGWTDVKLTTNAGQRSFIGFDRSGAKLIMGTVPNCTISQLGDVAMAYGLQQAMNLDGGASSGLYYNGSYLTPPGRNLSNAIVVARLKNPPPALIAKPTAAAVLVDRKPVAFDAYNIADSNYFKLRDLAFILNGSAKQFEVGWDNANNAISLTSGQAYTQVGGEMQAKSAGVKTPVPTRAKIYLDGAMVRLTGYTIEGSNYFKLRDIGQAFDLDIDWDDKSNTITIETFLYPNPELAALQSEISFDTKTDVAKEGRMKLAKAEEYMMNNLKSLRFYEKNGKYYFEGYVAELPQGFINKLEIRVNFVDGIEPKPPRIHISSDTSSILTGLPAAGPFKAEIKGISSFDQILSIYITTSIHAIKYTDFSLEVSWTLQYARDYRQYDTRIEVVDYVSSETSNVKMTDKPYDLSTIFTWLK